MYLGGVKHDFNTCSWSRVNWPGLRRGLFSPWRYINRPSLRWGLHTWFASMDQTYSWGLEITLATLSRTQQPFASCSDFLIYGDRSWVLVCAMCLAGSLMALFMCGFCRDQPSALAGIDHRLLLGSTVGFCWDRPQVARWALLMETVQGGLALQNDAPFQCFSLLFKGTNTGVTG
jgi:hypothetical protein